MEKNHTIAKRLENGGKFVKGSYLPATAEKTNQAKGSPATQKQGYILAAWYKKPVVWALLIFALVNLVLWTQVASDKQSKNLWSGTGSIDLALNDFQKLNNAPEVVLLGSSLMMFPFWSMDCERDRSVGDIFHHHRSRVLESELGKEGFSNPTVFSFAIFGQMVSDAYIYVNEYLREDRAPKFLIYGIAPRDFSDYDLPSPMSTNSFKRLVNLGNFSRYAGLYLPGFQDQSDFVLSHACYFYGKRWRFQQELNKGVNKLYAIAGFAVPQSNSDVDDKKSAFMLYGSTEERWTNSKKEYERRYRNIGERSLDVQMGFLQKLLDTCHERGIKVILVNMPLSDVNRSIFPPGFYDKFRRELSAKANKRDVRLVDIGNSNEFTHLDFWDTAHLEQAGGHKIVSKILPIMKEMSQGD